MNLLYAMSASVIVSLVSLVGILGLMFNDEQLKKIIIYLVAFAAGGLIGGAFLEIIPEAMEHLKDTTHLFLLVIAGFSVFFVLEKYLHWRHCHHVECGVHPFTYLNIAGDSAHNFSDGLIMGALFYTDIKVGFAATVAIVLHEIPHELGNFALLVHGGFSKGRALFFNFIAALFAVVGTGIGFCFAERISGFAGMLLPVAAGGFIYIAACDLIPELHREKGAKKSALTVAAFFLGLILMYVLVAFVRE